MMEKDFRIKVAGQAARIETLHRHTYELCRDYRTDEEAALHIRVTQSDIERERAESLSLGYHQSDGYLETLAVYRKLSEEMLEHDTFLMHGAAVAMDGGAYLFLGKSGTGKTTHIRLWLKNLPDAFVVNGDKPLIRVTKKEALVFGTPWCGKEQMNTNTVSPLRAIILMERNEENRMEKISFSRAFPVLLQQTYRPKDAEKAKKTLSLLARLNGQVRFYRFQFNNLKEDAFGVAYEALCRESD